MEFDISTARPADGGGFDLSTAKPNYDRSIFANGPLKIGKEAYGDTLRKELNDAGWANRNIAGAGTALSNVYEGAKQLIGQGDQQAIENNNIISESAPVGSFVGNAALTAIPFAAVGTGVKAAGAVGAGIGMLQPVDGDQTLSNIAKGKLINTAEGAAFGAGGQKLANSASGYFARKLNEQALLKAQRAPIDKTLQDAIDVGLVVPPSSVNPSFMNTLKEGIAGKIATAQTASNQNSTVIDSLARKAIGVADDVPLTSETTQQVRRAAYAHGYDPIAKVGKIPTDQEYKDALWAIANKYQGVSRSFPGSVKNDIAETVKPFQVDGFNSNDALQASQFLRDKANEAFKAGNTNGGHAAKSLAKAVEDQIERNLQYRSNGKTAFDEIDSVLGRRMSGADFDAVNQAKTIAGRLKSGKLTQDEAISQIGQIQTSSKTATSAIDRVSELLSSLSNNKEHATDLLKNFREARKYMAKAHTVEDAIVEGGGSTNPKKLAQRVQAGKPMSDELAVIGNFANNFPKATQPAAQVAGPGVSKLNGLMSLLLGTGGSAMGPAGMIAGAVAPHVIPPLVRSRLLSKGAQEGLIPTYGPTRSNKLSAALLKNSPVGLTALGMPAFNQ